VTIIISSMHSAHAAAGSAVTGEDHYLLFLVCASVTKSSCGTVADMIVTVVTLVDVR